MASISTNSFDLLHFPKARYADDNGTPVVVIPVNDPDFFRIKNEDGVTSITCSVICQEKFKKPINETAPTHDFMQNFTSEQKQKKVAEMLKYITEKPEKMDYLIKANTRIKKQADGTYRYENNDGTVSEPQTIEQIASAITYGRMTFGPGWLLRKEAPKPTQSVNIQQAPAAEDNPYDCPF